MVTATSDLGVPLWVSVSCVRATDTGAVMFGIEESREAPDATQTYGPLADAVRDIMSVGGSAILMMHSVRDVTEDAVKVLREAYSGPVGAYPNAGYWVRPNWIFVDQVTPEAYLADARRWVDAGATIVGRLLRSGSRAHTRPCRGPVDGRRESTRAIAFFLCVGRDDRGHPESGFATGARRCFGGKRDVLLSRKGPRDTTVGRSEAVRARCRSSCSPASLTAFS